MGGYDDILSRSKTGGAANLSFSTDSGDPISTGSFFEGGRQVAWKQKLLNFLQIKKIIIPTNIFPKNLFDIFVQKYVRSVYFLTLEAIWKYWDKVCQKIAEKSQDS